MILQRRRGAGQQTFTDSIQPPLKDQILFIMCKKGQNKR